MSDIRLLTPGEVESLFRLHKATENWSELRKTATTYAACVALAKAGGYDDWRAALLSLRVTEVAP